MSGSSRNTSVESSHSEDHSFASDVSTDTVRSQSSSSEPSDSVGSHNSYTPRGRKVINSLQSEGDGAEINVSVYEPPSTNRDGSVYEPPSTNRDGSNGAAEPSIQDEVIIGVNEKNYFCVKTELLKDQSVCGGAASNPAFNPEEVKIERTLVDGEIDDILHRAFRASSSRVTKKMSKKRAPARRTTVRRGPGRHVPDPPGSTLCTDDSLNLL